MNEKQREIDELQKKLKAAKREKVYAQSKMKKLEQEQRISSNQLGGLVKESKKTKKVKSA